MEGNLAINVLNAEVGYGQVGLSGALGYRHEWTDDKVYLNSIQSCDFALSAHAPSRLEVAVDQPVAIAGATHVSFWASAEAQFFINYHHIGSLSLPGDITPWIHVPPGKYTLRIDIANRDWAHTLWLFRQSPYPSEGRLALVTLGCYREAELPGQLRWLFTSAAKHGILVHVYGVNEALGNWFSRKIEGLAAFIGELPDVYSWVVYLDGNDTFVIADEDEIVRKLSEYGTVVTGAEACPWPCRDSTFVERFVAPTIHRFPQAGGWGGERAALLRALWALQLQHYEMKVGKGPEWCYREGRPIENLWDDQFMWQVLHLREPERWFRPDYYWHVIANLTCTNTNPYRKDPFWVDAGRIVTRWNTRPALVHVSGVRKGLAGMWLGILQ